MKNKNITLDPTTRRNLFYQEVEQNLSPEDISVESSFELTVILKDASDDYSEYKKLAKQHGGKLILNQVANYMRSLTFDFAVPTVKPLE